MSFRQVLGSAVGADDILNRDMLIFGDGSGLPAARQNALRACVQNAAGARSQGRIEDIHRANVIDLPEQAAALRPELRIGGQVIHLAATAYGLFDGLTVANVAAEKLDLVQRQMSNARLWVFENPNPCASVQQLSDQVAADEPGSAGDEHQAVVVCHRTLP